MKAILKHSLLGLLFCSFINFKGLSQNQIVVDNDIQLIPLTDSIYIHVSWHYFEKFGNFPSNGLVIIKNGKALLIDTPIDIKKTERLANYISKNLHATIETLIIGHFHNDCLGGLPYLQSINVNSIANNLTIDICRENNLPIPSFGFTDSLQITFNNIPIVCKYFGPGHSPDNIVVWLPQQQILFGGCLVKEINSKNLGNLSDANIESWNNTISKILSNYPVINTVIPGHGVIGGIELLYHTIKLVEEHKKN